MTRILLVEDDYKVAGALTSALRKYRLSVPHVSAGDSVPDQLDGADLVLLDLSLPDVDGLDLCRRIRAESNTPIIILTGRAGTNDRVRGLRAGADDYVVKPVDVAELLARIHAVLRRYRPTEARPRVIRATDVNIDLMRQIVTVANTRITLTRKEFQLLALIAEEDGEVCSRDRLVQQIWGRPWPGAYSTLNVHIATLRSKIGRPEIVQTIRGVGYRLGRP
ncbi:response regulator transcription factor [Pseudonocardia eucalypti]|uniref:Sensory transduction protein RegX3 n=1 Tax=Pseudonocardia eucalypti TaxID=648755 RepID=A0ABP9R4P8_9PSEU|nr:DNA-binding response OmpR family regulator [Pseudonocardia eucalypti]